MSPGCGERLPVREVSGRTRLLVGLGVALALAAAALGLRALARSWFARSTLSFASRVTGLPLRDASVLEAGDDAELSAQLYAVLAPPAVDGLAATLPVADRPEPWPGDSFFRRETIDGFPHPGPDAELRGVHGCTEHNEWLGYLDARSGELWLEIMYPDMGGDAPGCGRPPWERR